MIPEAAVEAAWDKLHENPIRPIGIDYAELEAALEAAAPHIRAQALEDSADEWQVRMDTIGRGSVEAKVFMQQRAAIGRAAK